MAVAAPDSPIDAVDVAPISGTAAGPSVRCAVAYRTPCRSSPAYSALWMNTFATSSFVFGLIPKSRTRMFGSMLGSAPPEKRAKSFWYSVGF